eukprot:gene43903-53876_t
MGNLSGGDAPERRKYGDDFLDKEAFMAKHKEAKGDDYTEEDFEVEPKPEPAAEPQATEEAAAEAAGD